MLPIISLLPLGLVTVARAQHAQDINWQSCPGLNNNITILNGVEGAPFDCAKLSVPLDYTDPNSEPLELDLFRVNATQEPVLGTVLINFGGPGGTGAENLPIWARQLAANVGRQWHLVSWDPRGTGKTLPFNCMIDLTSASSSNTRKRDAMILASSNLTEYFVDGGWDYAGFVADGCNAAMNDTGRYIGTAFTAHDMMQIVDALGEDGLLRYYGWSYGTALGSYVAAMFPDRVERIVLDANVDPYAYQAGHYGDFVIDADKALAAFLQECLNNKQECALAEYTSANSTEDMVEAINTLLRPLATNASTSIEAWTLYSTIVGAIYNPLYYPASWPTLAETITNLLNGTSEPPPTPPSIEPYNEGAEWAVIGIRASDALWRTDSLEEYLPQAIHQESISSFDIPFPSIWISARWKINALERYTGDFNIRTKHPILYVNGEYDPATPLMNAYNASKGFEGSVVLPHSGYGHGILVEPSECVARYIRAYFENGTLPETDAHCEPDFGPWERAAAAGIAQGNDTGSEEDESVQEFTGTANSRGLSITTALVMTIAAVAANLLS